MSSIKDDLFPDHRIIIQTIIFCVTLGLANFYLIKPSLRLSNERKKRTSGAIDLAKSEESRADALQSQYDTTFKSRLEQIKSLRLAEITAGHKEAEEIYARARSKWDMHMSDVRGELDRSIATEKKQIPSVVSQVVESLLKSLGVAGIFALFFVTTFHANSALAQEEVVDTMQGIVWPYFNFAVYFIGIVYFGGKIITSVLESRREALRVKLTESKQALTIAQERATVFEAKMKAMDAELETLRSQYIVDGVNERNKIIAEAHALAEQMAKDAQRATHELIARGKEELRREVVDLALKTVESRITPDVAKVLNQNLNSEALSSIGQLATH